MPKCIKSIYHKTKQVENNREDGMPHVGDCFPKLENIDLSRNEIAHFMPDMFIQLVYLLRQDLSWNSLTEIQVSTFRGLHQLRILNLFYNQIETFETGSFDEDNFVHSIDILN